MWQEWYLDDDGWDKHHIICWINGHIFIWFYLCAMSSAMVNWRGSIFDHGTRWRPWTPTTIFTSPQFWHVDLSLKVWISQAKIVENHVKNNVEPFTSIVESITSRGITNRNWGQTIQDFPLSPHITAFTWRWVFPWTRCLGAAARLREVTRFWIDGLIILCYDNYPCSIIITIIIAPCWPVGVSWVYPTKHGDVTGFNQDNRGFCL